MAEAIQHIESKSGIIGSGPDKNTKEQIDRRTSQREQNTRLREMIDELNQTMGSTGTKLAFTLDRSSNKMIIKVINTDTQEVIRQIPSEEALHIAHHIQSLMGILYDATA